MTYNTSKDYAHLFELAKTHEVVCFAEYGDTGIMDVCKTFPIRDNMIEIGCRGYVYVSALATSNHSLFEDFVSQCTKKKLEFLVPDAVS